MLSWYADGGPFIAPLVVVGLAGLLLTAVRIIELSRRARVNARPFMERVIALVRAEKVDEALALCVEHSSAIPDVGIVLLRSGSRDASELHRLGQAATLRCMCGLRRRTAWILTLAVASVLLGVTGAAANLHASLASAGASVPLSSSTGPTHMASALAYALRPLLCGLVTAIPLILGHAYVREETETLSEQLEEFTARLSNALSAQPDERLGHRAGWGNGEVGIGKG